MTVPGVSQLADIRSGVDMLGLGFGPSLGTLCKQPAVSASGATALSGTSSARASSCRTKAVWLSRMPPLTCLRATFGRGPIGRPRSVFFI